MANFNGIIDDVRIYDYALTADQIRQIYNETAHLTINPNSETKIRMSTGLVGYWKMDEAIWDGTIGEVRDYSGKVNHGTSYNGANTTDGQIGKAGSFDGVDDYVGIPDNETTDFGFGSFTLSAWVKRIGPWVVTGGIISKEDTVNNHRYMLADGASEGYVNIFIRSGVNHVEKSIPFNLGDNKWHHLVMVVNRTSNLMALYADGIQRGTSFDISSITGAINPSQSIWIGRRQGGGSQRFNGLIDDIKIWNYARTAEQIKQDYERGLKGIP